jgi:hypothetical protein
VQEIEHRGFCQRRLGNAETAGRHWFDILADTREEQI